MEGRKIILADETEYPGGECGYADGVLWCYLPAGTDVSKAFADFTNPVKTVRIIFDYTLESVSYENQTDFRGLWIDTDGKIKVCMKKGA